MAKGGKGRKGGGGGGGKTRKYSRDNNGRFASTGTGATARGGRLLTAKGNKRTARALAGKTKTIEAAGQKGVLAKPKGLKPGAVKAKPAAATAPKAAKLPREQRLARASVTAKRIDKKLQAKANEAGAAFAERRRISSRASSKARTAAFGKEAVAGKASATALRASQRSNARVTRLSEEKGKYAQAARDAATKSTVKLAPKLATKPPEPAVKIAKRKPKTPAEIAAGREADRREMASILRKPARWLTPTPAAKPATAPKASTPAERIKIKTPIRRAMSTNRASVVTPGQRSRLETGKGAKIKGARLNSSVAKPRTAGNTKPQVASRVKRKLAAENAKMNQIQRRERIGARQGKQYERSLKREMLLERAKTFLESGKLPGKDNSIAAQRNTKQARQRLAAKNAERRSQAAPRQTAKQAAKSAKQDVAIRGRITEMRKQNARIARAQSNATKNADVRNSTAPMSKASFARRPSKKTMRSQLRADNALAFYANPAKALREVKKKPGFRKPRGMR